MTGRSSRGTVAGVLVSLVLVLSACGGGKPSNSATAPGRGGSGSAAATPSRGAADAVKLAFVGPLTGANAGLGIPIRDGAKVAVQEAQDAGVKVDLIDFDTQGDPAQASVISRQFLNDPRVVGVVGPTLSTESKTLLPDLQSNGIVMVSASASDVALPTVVPDETVFHRVVPDDNVQSAGISNYIVKELRPRSVIYINDTSDHGKGLAAATMKAVDAAGIPGQSFAIDPDSQDFAPVLADIKAANPDLVFYGGYYKAAGALVKQMRDVGVTAKFMSSEGSLDPGFITAAGAPSAEGAMFACACSFPAADAGGALGRFAARYTQINTGAPPDAYSVAGYDATNVMINGIKAGDSTRVKLLKYVEGYPSTAGIAETVSFQNNGDIRDSNTSIYTVVNSKITPVGSNG